MNASTRDLEKALLLTVDAEIELMYSFNKNHLPVDIATTVAMRMSRAAVSSVCRLGEEHPDSLTSTTRIALQHATDRLIELSADYERRIRLARNKEVLLPIWTA